MTEYMEYACIHHMYMSIYNMPCILISQNDIYSLVYFTTYGMNLE